MANAVNVNFRMDPDLKRSMEEVCAEMGLSMTTAFTIFAKKVSREHQFPLKSPPIPSIPKATSTISVKSSMILTPAKPSSPNMNCSRWTDEAAVGRGSVGRLLSLADAGQKAAEANQLSHKRHSANTYEGIGKPEPLKEI